VFLLYTANVYYDIVVGRVAYVQTRQENGKGHVMLSSVLEKVEIMIQS